MTIITTNATAKNDETPSEVSPLGIAKIKPRARTTRATKPRPVVLKLMSND